MVRRTLTLLSIMLIIIMIWRRVFNPIWGRLFRKYFNDRQTVSKKKEKYKRTTLLSFRTKLWVETNYLTYLVEYSQIILLLFRCLLIFNHVNWSVSKRNCLTIITNLSCEEILQFGSSSKRLSGLSKDNHLWRNKLINEFDFAQLRQFKAIEVDWMAKYRFARQSKLNLKQLDEDILHICPCEVYADLLQLIHDAIILYGDNNIEAIIDLVDKSRYEIPEEFKSYLR